MKHIYTPNEFLAFLSTIEDQLEHNPANGLSMFDVLKQLQSIRESKSHYGLVYWMRKQGSHVSVVSTPIDARWECEHSDVVFSTENFNFPGDTPQPIIDAIHEHFDVVMLAPMALIHNQVVVAENIPVDISSVAKFIKAIPNIQTPPFVNSIPKMKPTEYGRAIYQLFPPTEPTINNWNRILRCTTYIKPH